MPPVDPADLDRLLEPYGGFKLVYKKLLAMARRKLALYVGNSGGKVVTRQLDPEDAVHDAFARLFEEGFGLNDNVYFVLRNHVDNGIHTLEKSEHEKKTARVEGSEKLSHAYYREADRHLPTAPDRAAVADEVGQMVEIMQYLAANTTKDPQVAKLAQAIADGHSEPAALCNVTHMNRDEYDAAFKRLKRQFLRAQLASQEKKK